MMKWSGRAALIALGLAAVAAPIAVANAYQTQGTTAVDPKAASTFVDDLADRAFAILRDSSLSREQVRGNFREMLRENFAVRQIGDRLIRRHRPTITPAQYAAYTEAFPDFVIDTYADRLFEYANSDLKVIRALPRGSRGDVDVMTRITVPNLTRPIDAIWAVRRMPNGRFQITNLTVAGVNLALTQEADFSSYIQKHGFDALVAFMRNGNGRA